MRYRRNITLKNGKACLLRTADGNDAQAMLDSFNLTHAQTDFLRTYPDENTISVEDERRYLNEKAESAREIEICAVVDGKIVGSAGIECVGDRRKTRHRAELGISVERDFWGLGIGRALTCACIECARQAGYVQLELDVLAENARAYALYGSLGFTEYGRNPKGFRSDTGAWQEVVLMLLEL